MNSSMTINAGQQYGQKLVTRDDNKVVVEDKDYQSGSWEVSMNKDRTEFSVWQPYGCEGASYSVNVGPNGVEYTKHSGGMVSFAEGTERIDMPLQPHQYEWAGLSVAGSLIGTPLALLFPPPTAAS
jgi:hypothetical protein